MQDNPAQERYEITVDGAPAGFARYQLRGRRINVFHTEIDPACAGHGVGSALARGLLADVRARRLDLFPTCPFLSGFVARHAEEYLDLVPERLRDRVRARV